MRNIVLIKLRSYVNQITPPLGLGYLLKALQGVEGINPVFIDAQRDQMSDEALLARIVQLQPLMVGAQVFSVDYPCLLRLVPMIRRACPETRIVAGGAHVSGLPEPTLRALPDLDYLVRGEGEDAVCSLARALLQDASDPEVEQVPNLVYRSGDEIRMNPLQPVDVDEVGAPAWEILEPHKYSSIQHGTLHKSTRVVPIMTSRGCPYPCTFCAGHLISGKKIRRRNVKAVVDEIEFLQSTYGFEEFIIEDENFTFYKEHVLAFSDELTSRKIKCHLSFPSGIRVDRVDEEIVLHLKRMGTYLVSVGIESGSPKTLKAMKKNWDLQMVKDRIALLKRHGIIVHGGLILGFSGETMADINRTIDFAIESGIDTAYFGNYLPLPGTEDFERLIREGELKLEEIDWDAYTSYYGRIPFHPRDVSQEELLKAVRWATIRFYARPRAALHLLRRVTHLALLRRLVFRTRKLMR